MGKNVVTDFEADPTGLTDSTTAIQNAVNNTKGILFFPEGTYLCSGITISSSFLTLQGEGKGATTVINSTANVPTFKLSNGCQYVRIKQMTLDRDITATSGGDGISSAGVTVNIIRFDELEITNNYCGFNLGCTGYSYLTNCFVHDNYSHGIQITNGSVNSPCQWTIKDTLSQTNNASGLLIQAITYPISVGEIINFSTFANGHFGISVLGTSSSPVSGIRLLGGFIGEDNGNGIYLDTYSTFPHKFTGTLIESAGTSSCGRLQGMPAGNTGYGMLISANNSEVLLTGVIIRTNSFSGLYADSGIVTITGSDISYNGQANATGNKGGIYMGGGRLIANGCTMTGEQFGLILANDNHIITSNSLSGNSTAAYYTTFGSFVHTQYANNLIT